MKKARATSITEYPFASELVTDIHGQVSKVILDFRAYRELLETLEDVGLYRSMLKVRTEPGLDRDQAIALLDRK